MIQWHTHMPKSAARWRGSQVMNCSHSICSFPCFVSDGDTCLRTEELLDVTFPSFKSHPYIAKPIQSVPTITTFFLQPCELFFFRGLPTAISSSGPNRRQLGVHRHWPTYSFIDIDNPATVLLICSVATNVKCNLLGVFYSV